jgi:hypothetical protein
VLPALAMMVTVGAAAAAGESTHPWKLELELNGFFGLEESAQLAPTASVDRGPLHLEARYNYDNLKTATFFAGWGFRWGGEETFLRAVPLVGGAVGRSAGIVPGLEVEAQWWRFSYWLELEYLFDFKNGSSNFFYTWSEVNLELVSFLWVGASWQRFRQVHSDRELDVGPMIGAGVGPVSLSLYYYGIGTPDRWALLTLEVRFPKEK